MKLYCTIYEGDEVYDTISFTSTTEEGAYKQYWDFVDYLSHFMPFRRIEITKEEKF